jgi:fumarylacetoacetate (FAA) hydrolase
MKLATYQDGSRDGQLVVVSRDHATAHYASGIASRLQQVFDDWNFLSPQLEELYTTLNHGRARHAFAFEPARCMAPLPRAYQWVQACQGALPLQHGASGDLLGPREAIACPAGTAAWAVEAGLAVAHGDIAADTAADAALEAIRLVLLTGAVQQRGTDAPAAGEPARDAQACLASAFGPVAVTPDELGAAWQRGRVHLNIDTSGKGRPVGVVDAAAAMASHFGALLASLCAGHRLRAGGLLGSGALASTELAPGHSLRIDMAGAGGHSVFGSLELRLLPSA